MYQLPYFTQTVKLQIAPGFNLNSGDVFTDSIYDLRTLWIGAFTNPRHLTGLACGQGDGLSSLDESV